MSRLPTALDTAEVAARLRVAVARVSRRLRRETVGGLSPSAVSALMSLRRLGVATLSELAEAEGVAKPTMTVMAAHLELTGLIVKRGDVEDRRVVRAELTPAGEAAIARARSRRHALLHTRIRELSPEDLAVLGRAAELLEDLFAERP